jgi:hypothetical protein
MPTEGEDHAMQKTVLFGVLTRVVDSDPDVVTLWIRNPDPGAGK